MKAVAAAKRKALEKGEKAQSELYSLDGVFAILQKDGIEPSDKLNLMEVLSTLEKAALADDYFVSRKLFPNVGRGVAKHSNRDPLLTVMNTGRLLLGPRAHGDGDPAHALHVPVRRGTLGRLLCINQILAARLIMASTPSTRRELNGVAVWVLHHSIQSSRSRCRRERTS